MVTYELMLVVDPKAGDSVTSLVSKSLNNAKAESIKVSKIGRKMLAYPIRKNLEAEFVLFTFAADGEAPKVLSDILKVQREEVLRFLIIRSKEARVKKKAPSKEEKKVEVAAPKVTVKTVSKPKKVETEKVSKAKSAKIGKKEVKKVKSSNKKLETRNRKKTGKK